MRVLPNIGVTPIKPTMQDEWIRWLIRPLVIDASAYEVPSEESLIKLDTMEISYHWPPALKQQWLGCLSRADLNCYPAAAATSISTSFQRCLSCSDNP